MNPAILVVAKAPVPGQAKTRLTPPATPRQAAAIAAASLHDTLAAARATPGTRLVVALTGDLAAAADSVRLRRSLYGSTVISQRGNGFAERLANAHADVAGPRLQLGMDTPQVTPRLLADCLRLLAQRNTDAVLGPATDGGWWALGLRRREHAALLATVPMSQSDTGEHTLAALRDKGLIVRIAPELSDVDTMADAVAVARGLPGSYFAHAVTAVLPSLAAVAARPAEVAR
ncbi:MULTISPECIES: DUF2064 domain-containing protein [unclassified Crossiella]|uniref:TIGR04282 family arsenosugar biosynthesis glycosyltransferase n=1 Tax=unclassified Crossiella TaxID=2620835 RepID=UPI00200049BE|nr:MULTISPECIES: DUF2064 domain-containing protein [unclassified Crossiella]MCK2243049.1 DUF2064 domain-containing protein [Crossiella sp. S99.2]MCK2256926.1 DUF2064 domain-containing protein [Crossiella sp. S99.1]